MIKHQLIERRKLLRTTNTQCQVLYVSCRQKVQSGSHNNILNEYCQMNHREFSIDFELREHQPIILGRLGSSPKDRKQQIRNKCLDRYPNSKLSLVSRDTMNLLDSLTRANGSQAYECSCVAQIQKFLMMSYSLYLAYSHELSSYLGSLKLSLKAF